MWGVVVATIDSLVDPKPSGEKKNNRNWKHTAKTKKSGHYHVTYNYVDLKSNRPSKMASPEKKYDRKHQKPSAKSPPVHHCYRLLYLGRCRQGTRRLKTWWKLTSKSLGWKDSWPTWSQNNHFAAYFLTGLKKIHGKPLCGKQKQIWQTYGNTWNYGHTYLFWWINGTEWQQCAKVRLEAPFEQNNPEL